MISLYPLFELSKWKRQAIKGKLGTKSLKRLTKAKVRKPVTDYLAGYERGTKKILGRHSSKKHGTGSAREKFDWVPGDSRSQATTQSSGWKGEKSKIKVSGNRKFKDTDVFSKRHEGYETSEAGKRMKKGLPFKAATVEFSTDNVKRFGGSKGNHASAAVLKREADDIKRHKALYPHLKSHSDIAHLEKHRKKSGEDSIQNMSKKDVAKLDKRIDKKRFKAASRFVRYDRAANRLENLKNMLDNKANRGEYDEKEFEKAKDTYLRAHANINKLRYARDRNFPGLSQRVRI